jgi:hypothetical protein
LACVMIPSLLQASPRTCNFELPYASTLNTSVSQSAMTNSLSDSACSSVNARLSFCESVSPGFHTFTSPSQAPCFSYSTIGTTTVWVPDIFDDAVYTCEIDEQCTDSTVHSLAEFCGTVGNVLNQSSLRTPIPGPATTTQALWTTSPITPPTVTTSVVALTAPPVGGMTYPPCFTVRRWYGYIFWL